MSLLCTYEDYLGCCPYVNPYIDKSSYPRYCTQKFFLNCTDHLIISYHCFSDHQTCTFNQNLCMQNCFLLHISYFLCRLWFLWSSEMVWRACRSHYPPLWCSQAGYLWWVLWGYKGFPWPGWQDPCGSKQGWPGGHTTADACLWGPDVVSGESYQHPRGGQGVPGLLLGQAAAKHRQPPALWGWSTGSLPGHPGLATQCCPAQAQWPHQKSQTCQGKLGLSLVRALLYVSDL